ncbi:MAG: RNA polymerase sigma factor (sigma-70 family) [Planctomycetota bacterium]|jgi:RNA polymerase sigma factor (sigma-70 family)
MDELGNKSGNDKNNKPTTEFHVARAKRGDKGGFAQLYEHLAPSLDAWACIRVSGSLRDFVEPCDIVQEVWWRSMDAFDRYDPENSGFRPWMFQIATNVLLEWNRKRRRKVRIEPSSLSQRAESLPPELARQATSVGRGLAERDSVKKLVAMVGAMSKEDRDVFIQCGLEGKTSADAAVFVGVPEETVKKRWQRLREKLSTHSIWQEFDPTVY